MSKEEVQTDCGRFLGNPRPIAVCLLLTVLCALSCFSGGHIALAQSKTKNVLVVFSSYGQRNDLELIKRSVREHFPEQVNFYNTYLDYEQLGEKSYRESLAETLRRGYENVNLDVLIVDSIDALQFVTEYRDRVFPGVPIVFFGLSASELAGQKLLPGMTGITSAVGLRPTIDLALRLHPDAKAIAVIAESRGFWWSVAHSELIRHEDKIREIDLIGPPSAEEIRKVDALPPHTLVLFQLAPESSVERAVGAYDVLAAAATHLPTYSAWHTLCFDHGCVGGAYLDWDKAVASTGEIAARVLSGEKPENIPVVEDSNFQIMVDWRQLRRWHIPESALPPGSVILYREPGFLERYRKYVVGAITIIAAQALLIIGLLWQRERKRKAEAILRESEQRFRSMADSTPALIWMCDANGSVTYLNDRRLAFTGRDPVAGFSDTWTRYIHPDDRQRVSKANTRALRDQKPYAKEYRLRRRDGVYRWMFDVATPRVDGNGSFGGFIGSAVDITDQKLAREALEKVSGQLIEAQEKERSRIARELHDDICQRLALLSMEIEQVRRASASAAPAMNEALGEVQTHCSEIAADVQLLSHQLHSSKLDYLGVVAAVRGLCLEFSKKQNVRVEFVSRNVPRQLPREISLCLFRVAQEALHNAAKYSETDQFAVEVIGTGDEIQLVVTDPGTGFDVEEAKQRRGLGLLSMQERVNLVHGRLSVESKPGGGTRIFAAVPFPAASEVSVNAVESEVAKAKEEPA